MSRGRFAVLVVLLAVVVATASFAVGVALLDDDGPDDPPGGAADATSTTEPGAGEPAAGEPGDTTSSSTTSAAEGDDREQGPAWIAVISSEADQDAAADVAAEAAGAGVPTEVLHSDDHGSLEPGFWVAFAGPYASPPEAEAAVDALAGAGWPGAYVRCLGTAEQCA